MFAHFFFRILIHDKINYFSGKKNLRQPGVEPGSAAWKATMITATPLTLLKESSFFFYV